MRLKWIFLVSCLLIFQACSQNPKKGQSNTKIQIPKDHKEQLWKYFGPKLEAELAQSRLPANEKLENSLVQQLNIKLADLNKVKPNKFEIYVFPKISSVALKKSTKDAPLEVFLGKPQVMEVSALAVTSCKFLQEKGFKNVNAQVYFKDVADAGSKTCAIVEIKHRTLVNRDKALMTEGDEIAKRIYLDENYRTYGIETDYFSREDNKMNMKTVGEKFDQVVNASSALGLIPVDMPALGFMSQKTPARADSVFTVNKNANPEKDPSADPKIDKLAYNQILKNNKAFSIPNCELNQIVEKNDSTNQNYDHYIDHLDKRVKMYWCTGKPWPEVVDSSQFIAVTQTLTK